MDKLNCQIPAAALAVVQLLWKLNMIPGPMKAARIVGEDVNVWLIPMRGSAPIKRVSARLVRGKEYAPGSRRRVFLDVRVQEITGFKMGDPIWEWRAITDEDFQAAGLEPAMEYGE